MIERQLMRGFLASYKTFPPLVVAFKFNPETVSDTKAANYVDRDPDLGGNAPGKFYTGGGHRTISFDLKLHGLEQGNVIVSPSPIENGISIELAKLRSFMYPRWDPFDSVSISAQGKRVTSPPTCIFGFGTKILECVITDMTISETQYNSVLAPVRADVRITLIVIEDEDNSFYQADKYRRKVLAAIGLLNTPPFQGQ